MILRDFFFGLLIISVMVVGFSGFWGGLYMQPEYNLEAPSSNLTTFNQIDKTLEIAESFQGNTTGIAAILQSIDPTGGDIVGSVIAGTRVLSIAMQLPTLFSGMIGDAVSVIGLPSWIGGVVTAAIIISIIFSIIAQTIARGRV